MAEEDQLAKSGTTMAPQHVTETTGFWFSEDVTPDLRTAMRLKGMAYEDASQFQRIQIVETVPFGKTLVLDGKSQSARFDEFVYHECLVHPAMLLHGQPRNVFIGGGGELATAREVMKYATVEKCVMVDLDEKVVEVCKKELPEWGAGCTDDERLEVVCTDAYAWLKEHEQAFDVIIMDIADPIEAGPGYVLYTEEFYKFAVTRLNPGGVLVTQSGPGDLHNHTECCTVIHQTLRTAFERVCPYFASVPSFGSNWAWNVAWKAKDQAAGGQSSEVGEEALKMGRLHSDDDLDAILEKTLGERGPLTFYDAESHRGIFGVPKPIRQAIQAETRIMRIDSPVFMY